LGIGVHWEEALDPELLRGHVLGIPGVAMVVNRDRDI
jgi:hypothetical protein